jgi:hypothetical protein
VTLDEAFQLAAGGCQTPNCDHRHSGPLFVRARYHLRAKLDVSIDPVTRTILVQCGECRKPVVEITCP